MKLADNKLTLSHLWNLFSSSTIWARVKDVRGFFLFGWCLLWKLWPIRRATGKSWEIYLAVQFKFKHSQEDIEVCLFSIVWFTFKHTHKKTIKSGSLQLYDLHLNTKKKKKNPEVWQFSIVWFTFKLSQEKIDFLSFSVFKLRYAYELLWCGQYDPDSLEHF